MRWISYERGAQDRPILLSTWRTKEDLCSEHALDKSWRSFSSFFRVGLPLLGTQESKATRLVSLGVTTFPSTSLPSERFLKYRRIRQKTSIEPRWERGLPLRRRRALEGLLVPLYEKYSGVVHCTSAHLGWMRKHTQKAKLCHCVPRQFPWNHISPSQQYQLTTAG